MDGRTVGAVARLAGVSVRTLHHYDAVGLVVPSGRRPNGYRVYTDTDLRRLHRVLAYRELGFPLDEIAELVEDADADDSDHLRRQRELLLARMARLERMLRSLDTMLEARRMGIELTPEEMFEVFGDDDPTQYAEEAEQRWGDTDAWAESRRRTASYTKDDWVRMKAEAADVSVAILAAYQAGEPADSTVAMDAVEAHRLHICRWFYDCPRAMQVALGEMYVADPRFAEHYESQAPGLAQYVHDAIAANAARGDGATER